jgi:hypothetical protein
MRRSVLTIVLAAQMASNKLLNGNIAVFLLGRISGISGMSPWFSALSWKYRTIHYQPVRPGLAAAASARVVRRRQPG